MIKLKEEQYFVNGDYVYMTTIHRCLTTNRIYMSGFSKHIHLIKLVWFDESKKIEDIRLRHVQGGLIERAIIDHYGGWEFKYNDMYLPSRLPNEMYLTNQYGEIYDTNDFGFEQLYFKQ